MPDDFVHETIVKKSPISKQLQAKKLNFKELRSKFEVENPEIDAQKTAIVDQNKQVLCQFNVKKSGLNSTIISADRNLEKDRSFLVKDRSISKYLNPPIRSLKSRDRIESIVGLPNPENGKSPKSDKKERKTPCSRKKGKKMKETSRSESMITLKEFMERKKSIENSSLQGKSNSRN